MPKGTERPKDWTRERHAKARGRAMRALGSDDVWEETSLLAADLGHALDELERMAKEMAYLWTAGGITPNPAFDLAYSVWMAKEETA